MSAPRAAVLIAKRAFGEIQSGSRFAGNYRTSLRSAYGTSAFRQPAPAARAPSYGWEFLFLGANIDAIGTARCFGISADRAANFNSDPEGTRLNYDVLSDAVCEMRCAPARIGADWKKRIEEDFENRGRNPRR